MSLKNDYNHIKAQSKHAQFDVLRMYRVCVPPLGVHFVYNFLYVIVFSSSPYSLPFSLVMLQQYMLTSFLSHNIMML